MRLLRLAEELKESNGIKFQKDAYQKKAGLLWFLLDIPKFDRDWSTAWSYVGPGGEGQTHNRYQDFGKWLKENPQTPVIAPFVYAGEEGREPGFSNGRHRLSWFRDHGMKKIWVVIDPNQKKLFEEKYR